MYKQKPFTTFNSTDFKDQLWLWLVPVVLASLLISVSQYSFLLFHTLAEFFSIIVAIMLSVVAWQMYPFTRNNFLLYLGSGYFWIACLDIVHTLGYKGMNIVEYGGANYSTQLWIGTRFIEAILLLTAPRFLKHQLNPLLAFTGYGLISCLLLININTGYFPDTYIEGQGLTTFKIYSEYLIILLLAGALVYLWNQRNHLEAKIIRLIILSIVFTMFAELAFTLYISVYGLSNLVGHIFKLFSFWLIFIAMIRTTLQEPFLAMSRGANTYDAIPDATIVVDHTGDIRQANRQACKLAGLTVDKILGKNSHDLFHSQNQPQSDCPVCQSIAAEKPADTLEIKLSDNNKWFDISLSPISGLYGQHGMVQVLRDITQRKFAEEALRRSQKMEAIGQLSGGIAHDFNNQLGVITGYLEMLKEQCQNKDKPGRWIETSLKAAQRCIDLTRQLLCFSRQKPKQIKISNINSLINEMTVIINRTLTPEIQVSYQLADKLWTTDIDHGEFQDALLNLVINARDAMPDGGQLLIKTSNCEMTHDDRKLHPALDAGDYILLEVHDTGHGMDNQTQQYAFDPFFTTKLKGKGTGLGLAMVYGFIKRHRGEITIHCAPIKGCHFNIYLPRATTAETQQQLNIHNPEYTILTGSEVILLVDDEVDLLELASLYLQQLGYQVLTANCADDALDIISSNSNIDLIFTDVVMPDKNGFELIEQALNHRPDLKYIFTTGYTLNESHEKQLNQFHQLTLNKPYSREQVAQIVRKRLDS